MGQAVAPVFCKDIGVNVSNKCKNTDALAVKLSKEISDGYAKALEVFLRLVLLSCFIFKILLNVFNLGVYALILQQKKNSVDY